ncbi:MAG TPA: glycoside hydrolase family 5 protein, partial [Chitinispirillaceae bacterium]|nr:glycoside hydrolase family 5 protein [Chitinispirillaceae bacterium]
IRIPVTWKDHIGGAPDYTIDKAWMDRVEEVVKWALSNEMYVILNTHHDEWVTLTTGSQSSVTEELIKIWTQIAERFKNCNDFLVFETLNEPRLYGTQYEWSGGTDEARKVLNAYNKTIVTTIRGTGGNNALRHIMIPTHAATPMAAAQDALVIPNNDSRIIISQHTYWPYNFTMNKSAGATSSWGSATDKKECDDELDRIVNKFVKKGIPVVVGEWGAIDKSNTEARATHAQYYANAVRKRGMLSVYWDNGYEKAEGFALLKRSTCTWLYQTIVDGLIKGVNDVPVNINEMKRQSVSHDYNIVGSRVRYFLPEPQQVAFRIFNLQGKNITTIINGLQAKGFHEFRMPNTISSGNYVFELKTGNHIFSKNIAISK